MFGGVTFCGTLLAGVFYVRDTARRACHEYGRACEKLGQAVRAVNTRIQTGQGSGSEHTATHRLA